MQRAFATIIQNGPPDTGRATNAPLDCTRSPDHLLRRESKQGSLGERGHQRFLAESQAYFGSDLPQLLTGLKHAQECSPPRHIGSYAPFEKLWGSSVPLTENVRQYIAINMVVKRWVITVTNSEQGGFSNQTDARPNERRNSRQ